MDIVMLLFPRMTALDYVGPHEVLSRLPGVTVHRAAVVPGRIWCDSGMGLIADHGIAEISTADVLLIPGGSGIGPLLVNTQVIEWVQALAAKAEWTTSVCTGSLLLGAAGLLRDKPATTHWYATKKLATFGAQPTHQRVVESGNIITAAGVSAGIDMALTLAARLRGEDIAQAIQLGLEYDPQPPFDSGSPLKASAAIKATVEKVMFRDDPAPVS
ncbi:DJ-1/PfpI family protein [Acanthopleuribacter pedis]|uniref:DJ-1/PfpI family protein n=1 Tax=Acanthopleuribacter pedis TaxID=442870 RepID=A0A8J7U5S8_9BACT|nr:DJ-1/PfpI family protein [Acanthopleuribacter pedis]MBO1319626.1 DJ-1/PfpI family protein [Acanthopleuribacter pedis]